ncbi:MAG: DNA translocase FtsK, partial [Clostridia bacterium]|nr:DNA translocase FtsK [Clostridia bacterium]
SVCINTIITSILYKARPDEVKLILVDPKKVELNVYSGIPHLLIPVVSDPNQAAGALAWAVNEMESRFDKIEAEGVRNIKGYNKAIENDPSKEPMCQIVIIIDELADLMMTSRDSVETSICRIAQKARAAGIHLIIGTQRPSVDVITGLIKANIPSRIAFHVSSQVDSRTILDSAGAEKLLNNGDMLFFPVGIPKPRRIQGAFIDDNEVERVTTFLKKNSKGVSYNEEIIEEIKRETEKCAQSGKRKGTDGEDGGSMDGILDDPKFNEAVEVAFDANKISTSLLQRKLSIGFGRASKYIDAMCDMGIVSEPDGQKPREVLMTRSEYYERKNRLED